MDTRGTRRTQRGGGGAHGCTGRVHVVDEEHGSRHAGRRGEGTTDIRSPLGASQPGLPGTRTRSFEKPSYLELPVSAELERETLGRVMTSLELPGAVGWDIRNDVGRRRLEVGDRELGGQRSSAAEPVLLPAADEGAGRAGVRDGSTRGGERKPAPGAFAAPLDRPGSRSAAAIALRRRKHAQLGTAGCAQHISGRTTERAATGYEEIDEPRRSRYVRRCNVSVPTS
jgi:hypothetical protein